MTTGLIFTILICLLLTTGSVVAGFDSWRNLTGRKAYSTTGDAILSGMVAVLLFACLFAAIGIYAHETGPGFELLKSDWRCTRTHVVQDDDGNYEVCDQYSRI